MLGYAVVLDLSFSFCLGWLGSSRVTLYDRGWPYPVLYCTEGMSPL